MHAVFFFQVNSLLSGTLGFGVKRADIPGLQRHLLDLDPYADTLTEEFWETVGLNEFDPRNWKTWHVLNRNLEDINVVNLFMFF